MNDIGEPEWMRKIFDREVEPEVIGDSIAVIMALMRVARAVKAYWYMSPDTSPEYTDAQFEVAEALKALPEGLLDE